MKLINQSYEILEQKDFTLKGIKQFIERCARVSYKSEDKMTATSYEKFTNMLISRHHDRPLEFGTVHLKMSIITFNDFIENLFDYGVLNQIWIKYQYVGDMVYVTTNYRYYLDIKNKAYPEIDKCFTEEDNEYYPKRHTVHFIINRAIMDEFRTHIGLSHLAESTRYCNYSKNKFNNSITFIKPNWLNWGIPCEIIGGSDLEHDKYIAEVDTNGTIGKFFTTLKVAENKYLELIIKGLNPQQTRDALPLSIKSELISCGFEDAWNNFFYRRCANDAHPMARDIAKPIYEEFIKRGFISK